MWSAEADLESCHLGQRHLVPREGRAGHALRAFFAAALRRERQSGFLFPEFGTNSRYGLLTRTPYYWAINDSQDLTVAMDVHTQRGIGADIEYRYSLSQEARGQLIRLRRQREPPTRATSKGLPENRGYFKFQHYLAGDAEPVLQDRLQRHLRRQTLQDLRLHHGGPGPAACRDQRLRHPALGVRSTSSAAIYWYQDLTQPRSGRAPARSRDEAHERCASPCPACLACSTRAGLVRQLRPGGRGPRESARISTRASICPSRWRASSR